MKLLLLILLIPIISYSQISYKDVMSINSEKMFKKVMIENGYEFGSLEEDYLVYGFDIVRDSIEGNKSTKWSYYGVKDDVFTLSFSRNTSLYTFLNLINEDNSENEYDLIIKEIKKNCKYFDIITYINEDSSEENYVCYSCSESKYKGKIGFKISEGWGYIRLFINIE
jgi:hypothetical protein